MKLLDWIEFLGLMVLCILVAALGEPRPVGLVVGGIGAGTVVFATVRKLEGRDE